MGASKRIPLSQKSIAIAEKNLHSAKRQFELGATTINEVAEYNLDLADAKKEYTNALIDFEIAKAELKWAAGEELL
jgi:outer membrane protein TolC